MPRLIPCPSCDAHLFANERTCPHCGAETPRSINARVPALVIGLALTGCPEPEPVYGVPDPETSTGTTTDTTTGEPEYGVPDSSPMPKDE